MPGDPYSAGVGIAANTAKLVTDIINNEKAKKEAKQLEKSRPQYEISKLAKDDLALSESELASGGLSSRAESAYNSLNNKQFSASLGAILRGGGSVNNVADVFGENEDGKLRLAMMSDQMRLNQINNLTRSRSNYMEQEDKAFEFNKWKPWADKAQAVAEARKNAQNGIWSSIGGIAGLGMDYFGGKHDEQQYNNYLKTNSSNSVLRGTPPMQTNSISRDSTNTYQQIPGRQTQSREPMDYYSPDYNELYFKEGAWR